MKKKRNIDQNVICVLLRIRFLTLAIAIKLEIILLIV
jgi:hypothetical protein